MAINKESTSYTFIFSIVMVVIVAALLSTAAISLKPFQKNNQDQKKMQDILSAIRISCERSEAEGLFNKYVTQQIVLDIAGNQKENSVNAFNVDVQKEYRSYKAGALQEQELNYPLYVCNKNDSLFYIIPVVGKGLWGPIWGFIALNSDMNTIYGAKFDHQGETPGLGAEIKEEAFQLNFRGEKIFDESRNFVSVDVIKGGADINDIHGVDGITGGTITSNGVSQMLKNTLEIYVPYFNKMVSNTNVEQDNVESTVEIIMDSTAIEISEI